MDTPLGHVHHEYLWSDGTYYRRTLYGPARWQHWDTQAAVAFGGSVFVKPAWVEVTGPPAAEAA